MLIQVEKELSAPPRFKEESSCPNCGIPNAEHNMSIDKKLEDDLLHQFEDTLFDKMREGEPHETVLSKKIQLGNNSKPSH